jgi:uncharacterized protein
MQRIDETKTVIASDRLMLAEVKQAVAGLHPDATVLLYGSAARGQREADSDYDVLVLVATRLSSDADRRLRQAVYEVELKHEAVISVNIETMGRWSLPIVAASPYRRNVEKEGVLL